MTQLKIKNYKLKNKIIAGFFLAVAFMAPAQIVYGDNEVVNSVVGPTTETNNAIKIQYPTADKIKHPAVIAKNIIYVIDGILGIIMVILLTYGGFIWMTAAGDSKKTDKARDLMQQSIVGLIIIIATWALAWFIIEKIGEAVFGGSTT